MTKLTKVLLALTALMLIVLVMQHSPDKSADSRIGELVFPDLKNQLAEVDQLHLQSAGQEAVIVKEGGSWKVQSRYGYPADFGKLSGLLNGLAGGRYLEKKTARPENHQQLDLAFVDNPQSNALLVTVSSDEDRLVNIVLGKSSDRLEGRYFRFPDQDQSWLLDKDLYVTADPASWLEHAVIDVPEQDVEQITQSVFGEKAFVVIREKKEYGNLMIEDMPSGKKLLYPTATNELGRALVNLRLKDVSLGTDLDWSTANRTDFSCKNNLQVVVMSLQQGDRYFLKIDAQAVKADADDTHAKNLSARLQPWIFEVSQPTYQPFSKKLSDFVVDKKDDGKAK